MLACSACYGMFMAGSFKAYGMSEAGIKSDVFVTTVGSLGAATNGLGRPFWALLQDRYGFKPVFTVLLLIEICVACSMPVWQENQWLFLTRVLLSYFTLAGHFAMFPTVVATLYGSVIGGYVYSFIFTGFAISTIIGLAYSHWGLAQYGYS